MAKRKTATASLGLEQVTKINSFTGGNNEHTQPGKVSGHLRSF